MLRPNQQDLYESFEKAELEIYQACPVRTYFEDVVSKVDQLRAHFDVNVIGEVPLKDINLPVYRVATPNITSSMKKILLTAGVHGNEAGGVSGALQFLEEDAHRLSSDIGIVAYPCLNPRGYVLNSRWTGEAPLSRTDLNRNFSPESSLPEVSMFNNSLKSNSFKYDVTIDLHETMPGIIMDIQYPDQAIDFYEKPPQSFYMWEICEDHTKRVGGSVVNILKRHIEVCDWESISNDLNSGGVISYPEGARNPHYFNGPLDSYLHRHFTDHAFTTETYGDLPLHERGKIHQLVIKLIIQEIDKSI